MRMLRSLFSLKFITLNFLLIGLSISASAGDATAFSLIKKGNRYIGEQAHDRVVQIRSEKSIGGITPTVWYVVYYDHTATLKTVQVKFAAGEMQEVKRPLRLLEPVTGGNQPLDKDKLKIDSDRAIEIATKQPILERVTVRATSAKLERGPDGTPAWKIRIWAQKLRKPTEDADLGLVILSAEDGRVIQNDLNINKAD